MSDPKCVLSSLLGYCLKIFVLEQFQKGWPEPVVATTTRRTVKTEKAKLWSTTVGEY